MSNAIPSRVSAPWTYQAAPHSQDVFNTSSRDWSRLLLEAAVVTLIAASLYVGLQGELPYHDASRFTNQVTSGAPVWDIGHLLLQPFALVLQRLTQADPVFVLKELSSGATAIAIGLFYVLLGRQGLSRWKAILGTLLLAGTCSVLTLAPSAHPKLVAFPFVTASLLCFCEIERAQRRPVAALLIGSVLLAIAAAFLASALATAPFVALAVLFETRRSGQPWRIAVTQAAMVAATIGTAFLLLILVFYPLLTGQPLSLHGIIGSVAEKTDLMTQPSSLPVQAARAVFGTANNFVSMVGVGATAQALMKGQIASLRPYQELLPAFVTFVITLAVLAAVYLRAALFVVTRRTLSIPIAFLCGAQAWSIWYGLNDPEHWFQLSAPIILLFLTLMPNWTVRSVFPAWTVLVIALNLVILAVPVASYPLAHHQSALARMLAPGDRLVMFTAYPGRPSTSFFHLPEEQTEQLDTMLLKATSSMPTVLDQIDADISRTLSQGGKVIVSDVFDSHDWEAPWMALLGLGVTKDRLYATLLHGRTATRLDDLGGIKLWQLRPSQAETTDAAGASHP